jgi:hypothetical protein
MQMNWEQKFEALNAIAECAIKMRKPGDWYIHQNADVKDGSVLIGVYGNGKTPQEAVEDHWRVLVEPATSFKPIVVIRHLDDRTDRKHYTWNGYRWVEHALPKVVAA